MEFAFVEVDDRGKPTDTLQVRSHCMRGKNRRQDSRRSRRALRQREAQAQLHQNQAHRTEEMEPSCQSTNSSTSKPLACSRLHHGRQHMTHHALCSSVQDYHSLPGGMHADPDSIELLYTYGHLKEAIYPIGLCVDFEVVPSEHVGLFAKSPAFVHSILFLGSALRDLARQTPLTRTTLDHLRRTLYLLGVALSQGHGQAYEALLYTVFNLSLAATLVGEDEAFQIHLSGIRQILRLRDRQAGQKCLNSRLGFKICRLELSAYTSTGALPPLQVGPLCWDSCYRDQAQLDSPCQAVTNLTANGPLRTIFSDLGRLVDRVNGRYGGPGCVPGVEFQGATSSIQTRLLRLQIETEDVWGECLRLGMLAFLSTTLLAPGPGRRQSSVFLAAELKRAICRLEGSEVSTDGRDVVLWLLMVGCISVFAPDEPWIWERWAQTGAPGLRWEEVEARLRGVLWIDRIHREHALKTFSIICRGLSVYQ